MTQQGRAGAEAEAGADTDAVAIQLSWHAPEHFTALFRRHAPYIQRYVTRRLGQDAAEDIVAETFPDRVPPAVLLRSEPRGRAALPVFFLILADVPGVTVKQVTDAASQADAAFSFPFTDGITQILVNASTHRFAGYVRDGVETVITKEAPVAGPGSSAPWVIHYK